MNEILLQLILFTPFYFIWKNDCKKIGKNNLAVNLKERFYAWCLVCPLWLFGLIRIFFKK